MDPILKIPGGIVDVGGGPPVGRCYSFDGANDYITCGNTTALVGSISIAAWVYLPDSFATRQYIVSKMPSSADTGFAINIEANRTIRSLVGIGSFIARLSTFVVPKESWTQIAFTYNHSTGHLLWYVNGVKDALNAISPGSPLVANSNNLMLGQLVSSGFYSGKMFDVRIFSSVLSDANVLALKQQGLAALPATPSYLKIPCTDTSETTASDTSGNGRHGTLVGTGPSFFYSGADVPTDGIA